MSNMEKQYQVQEWVDTAGKLVNFRRNVYYWNE